MTTKFVWQAYNLSLKRIWPYKVSSRVSSVGYNQDGVNHDRMYTDVAGLAILYYINYESMATI